MKLLHKEGIYEIYDTGELSNPISVFVKIHSNMMKLRYRCQTLNEAKDFIKKSK